MHAHNIESHKPKENAVLLLKIQSFSRDLLLYLMEFIEYDDKLEFMRCCRGWYLQYMKKYIRRLFILNENNDLQERIQQLISDPFRQLSLSHRLLSGELWNELNYCCKELTYHAKEFVETMTYTNRLTVQKLTIAGMNTSPEVLNRLHQLTESPNFTLSLIFFARSKEIPFLPFVKRLSLHNTSDIKDSLVSYAHTLQRLSLLDSLMTDVSMLGSIPRLELIQCNIIVDISALNNNEHVVVRNCKKILDYSQSFVNSKKIEIRLPNGDHGIVIYQFNPMRWAKVEELKLELESSFIDINVKENHSNQLPKTIKRCQLERKAVSAIDFTATSNYHCLQMLKLYNNYTFTSLEGYGLERVAIIHLDFLSSLRTLTGVGGGRNRKVTITSCHGITDFSPLDRVPIVEITGCYGFSDPLQVRNVRDLTIRPGKAISFKTNLYPNNAYENIHSLTLLDTKHVEGLEGLEKIPVLTLGFTSFHFLNNFLSGGKQFENQQIVLEGCHNNNPTNLQYLHREFMKDHYDCFDGLPKRWTWILKKK